MIGKDAGRGRGHADTGAPAGSEEGPLVTPGQWREAGLKSQRTSNVRKEAELSEPS